MIDFLSLLNTAIHKVLKYDLGAKKQLQKMQGRSLCWNVSGLGLMVVCRVEDGQIIIDDRARPCQVTIDASPKEMFDLWKNYNSDVSINLQMHGNPLALQDFSQFFKSLNIDWEAILEEYIGATNSHMVGRFANEVSRKISRIKEDIRAYNRDEINSL